MKLKLAVEKLQKSLLKGLKSDSYYCDDENEEACESNYVPEDVKEGHFAVIADDGKELKRFVIPLKCLSQPTFLRLLEQSAEEYGFGQEGTLTIPCRPSELERILAEQWQQEEEEDSESAVGVTSWDSIKAIVQSY